jgi:hypothetical protein
MAPKRASKQQQQLNVDQFHVCKQINVPGSFWQGRMLPDERDKVYKCTIIDFSLAHKFTPDSSPRMAFNMQEMGIDGTGSHEQSDLASTMYWIDYPLPFHRFYYDTFPAVDDGLDGAAEVASLARAGGARDDCVSSAKVTHTDVHPEFPSLRIPGLIADPNLLPSHLLMLVMVGFNKNAFKPQIAAITDKYYEMFRNKSKS